MAGYEIAVMLILTVVLLAGRERRGRAFIAEPIERPLQPAAAL